MFSSWSPTGLRRWREDRLRQLLGLAQAVGQGDAADAAGALVILPAAADEVPARDRFHRNRLEFLRHYRAPGVARRVDTGGQYAGDVDASEVVGHQVRGAVEPEIADLAQHFALARDWIGQDDIGGQRFGFGAKSINHPGTHAGETGNHPASEELILRGGVHHHIAVTGTDHRQVIHALGQARE